MKYHARHALVRAKQMLGLSTRPDKTFFVERLSRLLRSGAVSKRIRVMADGKDDGAGSQALCEMSAMSFAAAHGIGRVHRPFTVIEHAEPGVDDWIGLWERYFNLGEGAVTVADLDLPVVAIADFLGAPRLWQTEVIVSAEHFLHFTKVEPRAWFAIVDDLRSRYRSYDPPRAPDDPLVVALHVRRGDVSESCNVTSNSFTPNDAFMTTLESIDKALGGLGRQYRLELHSQGSAEPFAAFAQKGCELMLEWPAVETHKRLVNADILVMSRSAFSFSAALLNRGVCLYDPHKYTPLPGWITREQSGAFEIASLQALLAHPASRPQPQQN